MFNISDPKSFTEYLYSRLPRVYSDKDKSTFYKKDSTIDPSTGEIIENEENEFLYKYLYILVNGGYNKIINSSYKTIKQKQYDSQGSLITKTLPTGEVVPDYKEINQLNGLGINDLALLFDPLKCPDSLFPYLYNSFGLTYYDSIDISYQRKFLSNIGYLNQIKGTLPEVKYIIKLLTGMESDAWYEYDEENNSRNLKILAYVTGVEDIKNIGTESDVVISFLKTRIPFYLTPDISIKVEGNIIYDDTYYMQKLIINKGYKLFEISEEELNTKKDRRA